jgi:tripartite-type tricarboxylate transporter receptor subunit TctC
MPSTQRFVLMMACCGTLATAVPAAAQNYPSKAVRLIVPFAGADIVARMLAAKLSPALGQQVIPDPRFGASGNIAHEAAARAAPDGYTLLMGALPIVINPNLNPKVGYDPVRDFTAIAPLASIPNALIVHPSVPARTVKELVQLARKSPGKLTYASSGVGSAGHIAAELLKSVTKTDLLHVPYKSATIGLVGATSGEVDLVVVVVPAAVPYVNQGRVRALAVLDTKRAASLPQTPSSAEAGIPQVIASNWYMLLAPAGTPRAIVERLNMESVKAMSAADTRERALALGTEPTSGTPEQAAEFLRTEYTRIGKVIRDAGIKGD